MKVLKKIGALLIVGMLVFAMPTVSLAGQKEITLEWNHDGVDLDTFKLYYGTAPGGPYTNNVVMDVVDVMAGVFQTVEIILAPDNAETTYYFAVTALDSDGNESDFSNEVSFIVDFENPSEPYQLKIIIKVKP